MGRWSRLRKIIMMMETKKTLNDLIGEGYAYPDYVDPATQELITAWFGIRQTIPNFKYFFERSLALHYPYYQQLLRVDPTSAQYDWFVENYQEKQTLIKDISTTTNTGEVVDNGNTSVNNTNTHSGSNDNDLTHTETGSADTTDSTSTATSARTNEVQRSNPMSAEYTAANLEPTELLSAGTTGAIATVTNQGGEMVNPKIYNPTGSAQGSNRQLSNTANKNNQTTSSNIRDVTHATDSATDTLTGKTTNTNTQNTTQSGSVDRDNQIREISTGRTQSLSELINSVKATIQSSMSWIWLYHELDKCFVGVFDLEDY